MSRLEIKSEMFGKKILKPETNTLRPGYKVNFWLVPNGMGFHTIRFFGYMVKFRIYGQFSSLIGCKTDGINAHI